MKITHNKVGTNLNITDSSKLDKAGKSKDKGTQSIDDLLDTKSSDSASTVKLSDRAQDIQRIRAQVNATPDVDAEKVAKYQKLVDSGNYKVDSEAVADKMVDEHMAFGD